MTMAMQLSKFIPLYGPDFSGKAVAQGLLEPPDQAKAEASNTSFWLVLDHRGNTVSLCMRYRKRPPESLQSQKKDMILTLPLPPTPVRPRHLHHPFSTPSIPPSLFCSSFPFPL